MSAPISIRGRRRLTSRAGDDGSTSLDCSDPDGNVIRILFAASTSPMNWQ